MKVACRIRFLPVVLLLFVPAFSAGAQTELRGRVVSDAGKPIAGATVTLTGVRYSVKTDSLGQFVLAGTPGSTLGLSLRADGFRDEQASVVLPRSKSFAKDFVMTSEATPLPETNPSDRVLNVRVTTAEGEPIAYPNLQVNGGRRFVGDDSGRFSVPMPTGGRTTLVLRRIGFEPTEFSLTAMPDTALRLQMRSVARTLDAQVVTVRSPFARLELGGFYNRMDEVENGARVGYFMTPEDLAMRQAQNVTDAVVHFPSLRLAPIDDGVIGSDGLAHADGTPQRRKFRIEGRTGCPFTVYLDRVRIQPIVGSSSGRMEQMDEEINSIVQISSVAGIEVYPRAAGAPPEFPAVNSKSIGECGVILIWTK